MERRKKLEREITRRLKELPKLKGKRRREAKQVVDGLISGVEEDIARVEGILEKYKMGDRLEALVALKEHLRETSGREEEFLRTVERLEKRSWE